jgi:hypothetical protein
VQIEWILEAEREANPKYTRRGAWAVLPGIWYVLFLILCGECLISQIVRMSCAEETVTTHVMTVRVWG